MKGMGIFISSLLVIDTFFACYYMGFHSRTISVIDPSLKPVQPAPAKTVGEGIAPKAARASRSDAELPYLPGSRSAKTPAKATAKATAKTSSKTSVKSTAKTAAKSAAKPTAKATSKSTKPVSNP